MCSRNGRLGAGMVALAAASLGMTAPAAKAEHNERQMGVSFRFGDVRLGIGTDRGYAGIRRPFDAPVFKTIERQVWREPIYENRLVAVKIPARFESRRIPQHDRWGRRIGDRWIEVEVEPARGVHRTERVLVRAGYFETVIERVLVNSAPSRLAAHRVPTGPIREITGRPLDRDDHRWNGHDDRRDDNRSRNGSNFGSGFRFDR